MSASQSQILTTLHRAVDAVEQRINAACDRAGRKRSAIQLVAVTKTLPDNLIPLLPEAGLDVLAENRPQVLWRRHELVEGRARWHMIGHLQRNKIERTLPLVELVHSADSLRLLSAINQLALSQGHRVRVLIEVNTSGEENKGGFAPNDLERNIAAINDLRAVHVCGLMTMAPLEEDPEHCRPCFWELRRLRDSLASALAPAHSLTELSMGMSNDFEVAIEEGATLVRIGSALFGDVATGSGASG